MTTGLKKENLGAGFMVNWWQFGQKNSSLRPTLIYKIAIKVHDYLHTRIERKKYENYDCYKKSTIKKLFSIKWYFVPFHVLMYSYIYIH